MSKQWETELRAKSRPEKISILSSFFKTGKGEYGEGDIFIGVTVPDNRKVAWLHADDDINAIGRMLDSPIHEFRLSALLALVRRFAKASRHNDAATMDAIVAFYLSRTASINNWDLVDLSAPYIIGEWVAADKHREQLLADLVGSESIWERRIGIVSTMTLIRKGNPSPTLLLAPRLFSDSEPLLHKATGWMLREVGKKSEPTLTKFLDNHAPDMSATTLSYAIERLTSEQRLHYRSMRKEGRRTL